MRAMDKDGSARKMVYCNTEENVTTMIMVRYNPAIDRITYRRARFYKSHGLNGGSITNHECPAYLGVTVAERVLSKVFKNVKRMPYKNPGYDLICGQGYEIDVKSSVMRGTRVAWSFGINHNRIADYFLCLAFDNREDLNPMHIWLIPGRKINHLAGLSISVTTIDKWSQYELTDKLDKVIACCNVMRSDAMTIPELRKEVYAND